MVHRVTMESIKRSLTSIREGLVEQGADIPPGLPLAEWRERMAAGAVMTGVFTDETLIGDGKNNNPLGVNQTWLQVQFVPNIDGGTY